jgi:hypothetical protein
VSQEGQWALEKLQLSMGAMFSSLVMLTAYKKLGKIQSAKFVTFFVACKKHQKLPSLVKNHSIWSHEAPTAKCMAQSRSTKDTEKIPRQNVA